MGTPRRRPPRRPCAGVTLVELMVAAAVMSVGLLGLFGAFRYISRALVVNRMQTLATNLAQERIESLKNLSYYDLLLSTASAYDTQFSPALAYDTGAYAAETITIGGIRFTRYTHVAMAAIVSGSVSELSYTYPDTGLKSITVHVVWNDNGTWKRWTLKNLLENPNINPLDATISGTVSVSGGGVLPGAAVSVEQNPSWSATSNASGVYSFGVYHGSYTVRASSAGYYDAVSTPTVVARGGNASVNLSLQAIATGTVAGTAWYNSDLVVSQVVASTVTAVGDGSSHDIEYVELFNPTTSAINIGQTGSYPKPVMLTYCDWNSTCKYDSSSSPFDVVNVTTYVPAGRYYLIASASYFYLAGGWVRPDAYYDSALSYPDDITNNKAACIRLYRESSSSWIDTVGWADTGHAPPSYEGTYIPNATGFNGLGSPSGHQIVRVSSPAAGAAVISAYGRAYDSDSNARDFLYPSDAMAGFTGIVHAPQTSSAAAVSVLAGKVPLGAHVSASDLYSGSTQTYAAYATSGSLSLPYAAFSLQGVTTGTWIVALASNTFSQQLSGVAVAQNDVTRVPNAATTPAWLASGLYHVPLDSATVMGFIKGIVTDPNNTPIADIIVQSGGEQKVTGSNGLYFMAVSSGAITLVVNPNNQNASYTQDIQAPVITQGAVTIQDVVLSLGGRATGYVTTGTTPLANQVVVALNGGSQAGSGTTDATGVFYISNLATGTYTVQPTLETGQDSSPNTLPLTLSSTGTVSVGTFTVSGAFGSIAGSVSDASGLITSGALLIASTATIASTPPAIVGSSAPAMTSYYMVSSQADGTYTLPVRGGWSYYLSAYVPVISPSGSVSITTKTYSGISVSASATTTKNVTIP
ncbi:MAG: carboxypeptidase regulatory-like domain-containing protein [Elusimicrobia bacterium]|nr:carboxypeptidase regulatory-like domain-containing protein [Elusimicrobiota bacterium]